ncbi:matrixin family metalloprotease [Limnoglobus roseus]|uniref:Peptidase M10 metallopeptidase domain-containing protein n=1 Tax=Limnoglobus roseus TaxID=2598579 RepID=A0A5C1ALK9_9BACT|nr:matrixin family metalloprotease [Limnoglobus roseus]QEL17788.1 hypothetical protein PX52LOC_04796 [Limnoglobus roseus]
MRHPRGLRVESLERRDTPASFGIAWPDAEHLTLSFAPDGTPVGHKANALPNLLSQLGPQAQIDVLRAFQSWAAVGNVNFGLVADDGSAFGVGAAEQGDPRFGDVRVGGVPLASDVLAVTAPYGPFSNYSGDVTVNTSAGYADGGPDLRTVLLQEAGHALSIGNSSDPASVMYEYYQGPRTGLSAGDIASIQALYGPRVADRFEGSGGNGTRGSATPYTGPLTADLTTTADVDIYSFKAGLLTRSVTINLGAAGLSLLTAKVELLDSNGNVIASALTTDPTTNDVTLSSNAINSFAKYFVRVSSARSDVFGIGAYALTVTQRSILTDVTGIVTNLLDDTGLNDTLSAATTLLSRGSAVGPQAEFVTQGGFGSATDVDVYRLTVPPTSDGSPINLLTTVWGQGGATLNPWVEVYDALGNPIATEVLTADGNTTTVQLRDVPSGQTYFLKLSSDTHARGNYVLSTDLRSDALTFPSGPVQSLDTLAPLVNGGLVLTQTGQVHLVLSADGTGVDTPGVEMVVTAEDGTVVATLTTAAHRGRSLDVFLTAGTYSIRFRALGTSAPVDFRLAAVVITDPVGATPVDPTDDPEPTSPPPPPPPPTGDPQPTSPPATTPPPTTPPPVGYTPIPFNPPDPGSDDGEPAVWY